MQVAAAPAFHDTVTLRAQNRDLKVMGDSPRRRGTRVAVTSPLAELQRPEIVEVHDSLDPAPCSDDDE